MVKHSKRQVLHERRVKKTGSKAFVYTEQRGLRELRFEVGQDSATENASIAESEDPSDKARFLNLAANRFLTKAGEKTLLSVMDEVRATKPNDEDEAIEAAVQKWH